MARNKVQYQKGLSEAEFERQYGSEEQCRAALPSGGGPMASSARTVAADGTA
jgi:hypothetical protein